VLRACITIEEEVGIRALGVIADGFVPQARAVALALGGSHIPIIVYPGVIPNDSIETFKDKVRTQMLPAFIESLEAGQDRGIIEAQSDPAPTDIVYRGDLDAVQDYFVERMWSDGLPIIPPTLKRVEAFLDHTSRDRQEVLGTLLPEFRSATVWNVAVNGVMAGCRPEYMPVLIAIVECLADPLFRIQDAGSTPGWEPLVTVSGPVVAELDFNTRGGVLRVGRRANSSIGRFTRLYMRNVPGLRTWPALTDKASIGSSFNMVLAEGDDFVSELGWPPYRVDQGFAASQSVVTVQSVHQISGPVYSGVSGGARAEEHLDTLSYFLASTSGPYAFTGLADGVWCPLLVLSPSVAKQLSEGGVDKPAIRQYLFEHARVPGHLYDWIAPQNGATYFRVDRELERDDLPAEFRRSVAEATDGTLPVLIRAESLGIVVAGDPGRNQSRFYMNNHKQGVPVSRAVSD
jgi:hypothetical protein